MEIDAAIHDERASKFDFRTACDAVVQLAAPVLASTATSAAWVEATSTFPTNVSATIGAPASSLQTSSPAAVSRAYTLWSWLPAYLCGNQPVRRLRQQFFTKSFLGDDAAVLARSSGEEFTSQRRRAGVASMAWRPTRRFSTNAP